MNFLQTEIKFFIMFANQAAYRLAALYLASRWIQMPMSIAQNEK